MLQTRDCNFVMEDELLHCVVVRGPSHGFSRKYFMLKSQWLVSVRAGIQSCSELLRHQLAHCSGPSAICFWRLRKEKKAFPIYLWTINCDLSVCWYWVNVVEEKGSQLRVCWSLFTKCSETFSAEITELFYCAFYFTVKGERGNSDLTDKMEAR